VATAALASLAGFLAVGIFDSLIDTPRFFLLFLLLAGASLCGERATSPDRQKV
jgi:hypothetical protein